MATSVSEAKLLPEALKFIPPASGAPTSHDYQRPTEALDHRNPGNNRPPDLSEAMKAVDDAFSSNGKSYVNEHRSNLVTLKRELDKVLAKQRNDLKRLEDKISDNELAMRAIDAGLGVLSELPDADKTEGEVNE